MLLLIYLFTNFQQIYHLIKRHAVDTILLAGLFLLAFTIYIYKVDVITPGIQGDELTIAIASEQILSSPEFVPFVPVNLGHPTPLLYLTGLSIHTFGRTITAIRLPYVLFGALSIAAFFVLLRLFFDKTIATTGSLLMLFSYPFIIVSRLAYEVSPEIFFQILSIIFLALAWEKKDLRYYVAIGLALGAGLYTYVGFRTFAPLILLATGYFIFKSTNITKIRIKLFCVTCAALFIVLVPLLSYSIDHPQEIMERTASLAPLNQNYPQTEITNELFSNVGRLPRLFFMGDPNVWENGDTNFRNNPSNVSMFDLGTFLFLLIGLFFLLRNNRKLLIIIVLLAVSPLVNDLFVIERIPEAIHPYGVGHPNTLRIAGIIPIIYFVIIYGVNKLRLLWKDSGINLAHIAFIFLAGIMFYNWYLYYEQPADNKNFSFYITNHNGVYVLDIVNLINTSNFNEVAVSPQVLSDGRFNYFIKKGVTVNVYDPKNYTDAIKKAQENQVTFFYALSNIQLAQQLITQGQVQGLQIEPLTLLGNINTLYAIAFVKTP